jgi:hypothetical protein
MKKLLAEQFYRPADHASSGNQRRPKIDRQCVDIRHSSMLLQAMLILLNAKTPV